jgi:putative ABC transport system permease protein
MFKNYFKTAWRSLWKHKFFSAINISGLTIGIASSLLLLSYVSFQFSYDDFNVNEKNIYRLNLDLYQNKERLFKSAENYSGLGPALKHDFPQVVAQARLYNMGYKNNCVFTVNNNHFRETKFLYADPSFLTMFSFPFIQGDPASALSQPYSAVISASEARKFFGDNNPVGKFIQMNDDDRNSELCKITGVFKDVPENSHIKFNILISYSTLDQRKGGLSIYENGWDRKDYYTYVQLRPGTNPDLLEERLPAFISQHIPAEKLSFTESKLTLQPLKKIHLGSSLIDEPENTGNKKAVSLLIVVAIFIITIAWVNYINLSTAASVNRAKEIGIRKVLGSKRGQLIKQFLTESFSVNAVSFVVAIALVQILQPALSHPLHVDFSLADLLTNFYGFMFICFMIGGTFFSGLYPAFVLSSFKPVSILKGKIKASKNGIALRKSLVIFQFSLSILLIIGTVVVYQQVHYMLYQDLGIKPAQVLVLDRPGHWDTARSMHNSYVERFKETLSKNPEIEAVGMSDELPGKEIRYPSEYTVNNAALNHIAINTVTVDDNYFHALGMKFLAGRNFSQQYKTDGNGLVLTEAAIKTLGFQQPRDAIGADVLSDNVHYNIIGVISDFHQMSLEKKLEPLAFQFNNSDAREFEYYLIKIKAGNVPRALADIQQAWDASFKDNPFSFSFLDDFFDKQYKDQIQFGLLFGAFSIIAIVIACTGLFALVAFMTQQRTKEIGVRKILGASARDVTFLLTKDFVRLILSANVVAWPLGWLIMNNWLKDFAYRIHISVLVFLMAGLTALIIAMATISFQAIKAAIANPIKSLRTE